MNDIKIHFTRHDRPLPAHAHATGASVPYPQGALLPAHVNRVALIEDGREIPRAAEIASAYPDGSVEWLHLPAVFRRNADGETPDYVVRFGNMAAKELIYRSPQTRWADGPASILQRTETWSRLSLSKIRWRATFQKDMRLEQWMPQPLNILSGANTQPEYVFDRGAGWFAGEWNGSCVTLLWRDFPNVQPKDVRFTMRGMIAHFWDARSTEYTPGPLDAWRLGFLHRRPHVCLGLDDETRGVLSTEPAKSELKEWPLASLENVTGIGASMSHELAVIRTPRRVQVGPSTIDVFEAAPIWAEAFQRNSIGLPDVDYIESTGVLGPGFVGVDSDFPRVERFLQESLWGHNAACERHGATGEFAWGLTPHREMPADGRPSLDRGGSPNQHYFGLATLWRQYLRDRSPHTLALARRLTRFVLNSCQCRSGDNDGQLAHGKGMFPWMDFAAVGHSVDPEGIWLAWLIDRNEWAKDGHAAWRMQVNRVAGTVTSLRAREATTTIHSLVTSGEPGLVAVGKHLAETKAQRPMVPVERPGPAWHPLCWNQALWAGATLEEWIAEGVPRINVGEEGVAMLALSAEAFRITGNRQLLLRHGPWLRTQLRRLARRDDKWDCYGLEPGPAGEHHVALQWPYFASALNAAGITEQELLDAYAEPGCYPHGQSRPTGDPRGLRVYVLVPDGAESLPLTFDLAQFSESMQDGEIRVTSPAGQIVSRLRTQGGVAAVRQSGRGVQRQSLTIQSPTPGLWKVDVGCNQISLYRPLSPFVEAAAIHRRRRSDWLSEDSRHETTDLRGFIAALDRPIQLTIQARTHDKLRQCRPTTVEVDGGESHSIMPILDPPQVWLLGTVPQPISLSSSWPDWSRFLCDTDTPAKEVGLFAGSVAELDAVRAALA